VTYTRYGQECLGECGTHGEEYWWCQKSRRWGGKHADPLWDYCSPQAIQNSGSQNTPFKGKARTRYNKPCKNTCEGLGKDYFWCDTLETDSWDYCSPEVTSAEPVIAKGGRPCAGICDTMGKSYTWCSVISVTDDSIKGYSSSWWDYCDTENKAINQSMLNTQATTNRFAHASNPSTRATVLATGKATTRKSRNPTKKPSRAHTRQNNTNASKAISCVPLLSALIITFASI